MPSGLAHAQQTRMWAFVRASGKIRRLLVRNREQAIRSLSTRSVFGTTAKAGE